MTATISVTNCRTPDGVVVGLIDGIIAMARVLRQSNLSATEIQEALKDLQQDEDMKFLMGAALQDWSFGEETHTLVGDDWELGDPLNNDHVPAIIETQAPMYKVVYANCTWPMGWDKEDSEIEFLSQEDLNKWMLDKAEWCMSSDNAFRSRVYLYVDGLPQPAGTAAWEASNFEILPFGWKPTVENCLEDMVWMKL